MRAKRDGGQTRLKTVEGEAARRVAANGNTLTVWDSKGGRVQHHDPQRLPVERRDHVVDSVLLPADVAVILPVGDVPRTSIAGPPRHPRRAIASTLLMRKLEPAPTSRR